jgi:2-oxoglutarate dehydrogenase E1 component
VLCSGKIYYDVITDDRRATARTVAVGRIEMLYPFPSEEVRALLAAYPGLREVVWLQEEPANMGPRKWVVPQLQELAPDGVTARYASRPERSSPAEGYPAAHKIEQHRLVTEALT